MNRKIGGLTPSFDLSQEAELGMRLYEDYYINKNYLKGAGPGQGGLWNDHITQREGELMAGGHFLFGIDKMNATAGMGGGSYELVDNGEYIDTPIGEDKDGTPIVSTVWKDLSYYRLVPGSGSPQKGQDTLHRLDPTKLLAVTNAMTEIANRLKGDGISKECQQYVTDKLSGISGFSSAGFADFLLKGGQFYDGTKSQALNINYRPPGSGYSRFSNLTVANIFSDGSQSALTSANPSTGFVVFYKPSAIDRGGKTKGVNPANLAFQFHEGLHGYGNANGLIGTEQSRCDQAGDRARSIKTVKPLTYHPGSFRKI